MKLLALLLCLFLLLPAAAPAVAEEDITGVWYAKVAMTEKQSLPMSAMEDSFWIEINADGTYVFGLNSDRITGPWQYSEKDRAVTLVNDDNKTEIALFLDENDWLYMSYEEMILAFRRGAPPMALPAQVNAASMDAFTGNWIATHIRLSSGKFITLDEVSFLYDFNTYSSAVIDDESISVVMGDDIEIMCQFDAPVRLTNGVLQVTPPDGILLRVDQVIAAEQDMITMTFFNTETNKDLITFYYMRAE